MGEVTEEPVEVACAILTRIEWVGLLRRFQTKVMYELGMGVVISAGVYRREVG